MTIIGLLRHGPTSWNSEKKIQGVADIPLDLDTFVVRPWQRLLDDHGPWHYLVTSPLNRCRQTCQLLFPQQLCEIDNDFREQDWGEWTGKTLKEINSSSPGSIKIEEARGWDFTPPGGESRTAVLARSCAALLRACKNRDGQRILITTHSGVINAVINHLENTPYLPDKSSSVAKRALHLLQYDGSKLCILRTNLQIE